MRQNFLGAAAVGCINAGGEAVGGIVHQPDRLKVILHLLDTDDRPETLLAHEFHAFFAVFLTTFFGQLVGLGVLDLRDATPTTDVGR